MRHSPVRGTHFYLVYYRLRDGRSIRTVSALLMQLVQTSAHDVRVQVDGLRRARQEVLVMGSHGRVKPESKESFLDEKDMEVSRFHIVGCRGTLIMKYHRNCACMPLVWILPRKPLRPSSHS